jgi:hypothetical protein
MAAWRLTLDPPHTYCTDKGKFKSQHSSDFTPAPNNPYQNTFKCPVTGVIMLRPGFLDNDWKTNLVPLSQFRYTQDFWQVVNRDTPGGLFTSVKPAPKTFLLIELIIQIAIIAILINATAQDDMKWALESKFTLGADEGFAVHYHGLTDEMLRKNNWFCVQWDNIGIHFSHTGLVRVYQYPDRNDLTQTPALIQQFEIGSPGDFLNKWGYFIFIPIPENGLAVYHSRMAQKQSLQTGSVNVSTTRGHLIHWPQRTMPDGTARMFEASPVRMAVNPYQQHMIGFQRLTFQASGTYTDGPFDIGYKVPRTTDILAAAPLASAQQTITGSLQKGDNTGAWTAGTDKQYCTQWALSTSDTRYTPFLNGYRLQWNPRFTTRNTTPLLLAQTIPANETAGKPLPDRMHDLEFSLDESARFEGKAQIMLSSAAGMAIAERADCTYKLEQSLDAGTTWTTYAAGLAKLAPQPKYDSFGFHYDVEVTLEDGWARLEEVEMETDMALDGLTLAEAFDTLLNCCQEPMLLEHPAHALDMRVPVTTGKKWAFKPVAGDKGGKIAGDLLLLLHTQGQEWRLREDYANNGYHIEARPKDATAGATWKGSPYAADGNDASRIFSFDTDGLEYTPEPPDANVFEVAGANDVDTNSRLVVSDICTNEASISDPTSKDYLGRIKKQIWVIPALPDAQIINRIVLRMRDESGHHRDKLTLPIRRYKPLLLPNLHVQIYRGALTSSPIWVDGWIKMIHVKTKGNDLETMFIDIDTVFEMKSRT